MRQHPVFQMHAFPLRQTNEILDSPNIVKNNNPCWLSCILYYEHDSDTLEFDSKLIKLVLHVLTQPPTTCYALSNFELSPGTNSRWSMIDLELADDIRTDKMQMPLTNISFNIIYTIVSLRSRALVFLFQNL